MGFLLYVTRPKGMYRRVGTAPQVLVSGDEKKLYYFVWEALHKVKIFILVENLSGLI